MSVNAGRRVYSLDEVLEIADCTYRQLDYWAREGFVTMMDVTTPGSGVARSWTSDTVREVVQLSALVNAGVNLCAAAEIVRSGGCLRAPGVVIQVARPVLPEPRDGATRRMTSYVEREAILDGLLRDHRRDNEEHYPTTQELYGRYAGSVLASGGRPAKLEVFRKWLNESPNVTSHKDRLGHPKRWRRRAHCA